jgi:hypothetical protein
MPMLFFFCRQFGAATSSESQSGFKLRYHPLSCETIRFEAHGFLRAESIDKTRARTSASKTSALDQAIN